MVDFGNSNVMLHCFGCLYLEYPINIDNLLYSLGFVMDLLH